MSESPAVRPRRRSFLYYTLWAVLIAGIVLIALSAYVYLQSIRTFEVRRLSLPTRIYTDFTPLRPGVAISRDALRERLDRLGYREEEVADEPGEYSLADGVFAIQIRSFQHPQGERPVLPVRLTFDGGAIGTVQGPDGSPVETAALEPELLASIMGDRLENRRPVTLDQIPQHVQDAVIVTEDVRFWQHPGVDPVGIFRALFRNVRARGVAEGGSTLTQQLVKNYYLTNEQTMRRKIVEAFMSVILDAKYSKREILEAYLNDIYLGRSRSISILGVGQASRHFFGKPVSEVSIAEAALLAGVIRSPNNYSPFTAPEVAMRRRSTVLGQMLKEEKITREQYEEAMEEPLPDKPSNERTELGSVPFYVDRVMQEMRVHYGVKDVEGRGLAIYTAIDLQAQEEATRALRAGLANLEKSSSRLRRSEDPLEGAIIVVDVPTGEIRALVGGRDYERSQFNRVLHAKRQVGSLFKPFVFLAAFEPSLSNQNITPATLVNDTRFILKRRFSKDWSPRNYNEDYRGVTTVHQALVHSLNSASVRLGLATGIGASVRAAKALGIETELPDVPSLVLGSVEIPPIEMAESFTTIARLGSRVPLRAVRYVASERGRPIGGGEIEPVQVFPARAVYLTVSIMEDVIDRGTAGSARRTFRKTAAGKTGTTNDRRDAWFVGFTPQTLALTWVGFDDNKPTGLSGSSGAVPIWARLMRAVTEGQADRPFPVPQGISFAPVDVQSGGLATVYCPSNQVESLPFKTGTQPGAPCAIHTAPEPPPPLYPEGMEVDPSFAPWGTDPTMPPPRDEPILDPGALPDRPPIQAPPPVPQPSTTAFPSGDRPRAEPRREPEPPPTPVPPPTVTDTGGAN
jgi:penicillin-binding protein 1B